MNERTFIAFLRGINVSGHRIIKMEDLKKLLSGLNLKDVHTYIQSGNLLFKSNLDEENIEKLITNEIKKTYGYDVKTFVLSYEKGQKILADCPFNLQQLKDKEAIYITLISWIPDKDKIEELTKVNSHDEFTVLGNIIYVLCKNGYSQTPFGNSVIEKYLKQEATSRKMNTLIKLLQIIN